MRRLLGDRVFYADLARIGLPVAVQSLLQAALAIVDSMMVGGLGEIPLAAVGVSLQYNMLLFAAYWGLMSGGTLFLAQYWGAGDHRGIARAFGLMTVSSMAVALLFALTGSLAPAAVLSLYTNEAQVIVRGTPYLRLLSLGMLAQTLAVSCSVLLRSTEHVKLPLFTGLASLVTNTALNWVLIYGRLGAPALGLTGAGLATLISTFLNLALILGVSLCTHNTLTRSFRRMFSFSRAFIKAFYIKCLPVILNEVLYGAAMLVINMVLGRQGALNLSALAIFRTLEGLIGSFFHGFANAASVMVGKQVGAGLHAGARTDARRFAVLTPLFTLAVCLAVLAFKGPILSLFQVNEVVVATVTGMLAIYTLTAPLRTGNYIQVTVYRAGGESRMGMVLEAGGIWLVGVPLVALTGLVLHAPFLVVFFMVYMEEIIKIVIETRYLLTDRWIKPVTPEGQAALAAEADQT